MGVTIHSKYVDDTTLMNADSLDVPFSELDDGVLKLGNHGYATCSAPITQNGTTVYWQEIQVYRHRDSDGAIIKQTIAKNDSGDGGLVLANGYCAYIILSDTDGASFLNSDVDTADMDGLVTVLNDKQAFVLFSRNDQASGTGMLHYVGLKQPQPLSGSSAITASASSTVVNFPTGYTMPSTHYAIAWSPNDTATTNFYDKKPRITTHGTTSFTVTHDSNAGSPGFDWFVMGK